MKHTPGPWTRKEGERFSHDQSAGVRGPDGMYIAAALDLNRYDRDEEVEANAHLIEAAPDLLNACEALLERFHYYDKGGNGILIGKVRAAIAKAKGGQS